MAAEKKGKNINYNFSLPKCPKKTMGEGSFANMPPEAKFLKFKDNPSYRGGNINSFTCDVEEVSGIYENERAE